MFKMSLHYLKTAFQMSICFIGLISVILSIYQLQMFLAFRLGRPMTRSYQKNNYTTPAVDGKDAQGEVVEAVSSAIVDVLLVGVFAVQHSAMAYPNVRQFISRGGFGVAERCLYCLATSASVWFLTANWQAIPWYIWQFNGIWLHYFCFVMHGIVWIIIYGGCLQTDLAELVGVKQMYYYMKGLSDPMSTKSSDVCRLYEHMRHPSFIGFSALFWLNPYMSVDRLLLAVMLTVYMLLAWNVDRLDCQYQKEQLRKKEYGFTIANRFS